MIIYKNFFLLLSFLLFLSSCSSDSNQGNLSDKIYQNAQSMSQEIFQAKSLTALLKVYAPKEVSQEQKKRLLESEKLNKLVASYYEIAQKSEGEMQENNVTTLLDTILKVIYEYIVEFLSFWNWDTNSSDINSTLGDIDEEQALSIFYIDPILGDSNNDGRIDSPFLSFSSIPKNLTQKSKVVLRKGNYGAVSLDNFNPQNKIFFEAYENEEVIFSKLQITNSSNLSFRNIKIDGSTSGLTKENFMVISDTTSHDLEFNFMLIQSADDSSSWLKEDWYAKSIGGMDMRGDNITITHSTIKNVYHGVSLRGNNSYFAYNTIDNFAGDGIRGLGDNSTYEYNTVRDCYIDDYAIQHDDGFQAYRLASDKSYAIKNVTLRANKILLFGDPITDFIKQNNLVGTLMQGIIITDGHADSWVVENNLVVNAQYHGISLYGATNCKVQNNTVVSHPSFDKNTAPRIYLDDQKKSGQAHSNGENIIKNNITTTLTTWTFDATSMVQNNIDIDERVESNFDTIFENYAQLNFELNANSPALDSGDNEGVTLLDIQKRSRIINDIVDIGAFERR